MSELIKIVLCKYNPFRDGVQNNGVIIEITEPVEKHTAPLSTLEEVKKFYENQSSVLADALFNHLPQGTCDRLLIKLMQKKTSLYVGKTES